MKILGYNIDSVLSFDHIANGNAPSTYTENSYQKQNWARSIDASHTITTYNNKNVLSLTAMSNISRFYAKTISSNTLFVNQNFQFECKFVLDALNSENTLFTIYQSLTRYMALIVKPNSIVLNFNGKMLQCAYNFSKSIDYHITVGKIDSIYHFYINGELIGTTSSDYTIGQTLDSFSGLTSGTITYYLGFYTIVSNVTSGSLIGKIWDINISYGNTVKHYEGFSKYSDNLIYKVNTANSKLTTNANSYKTDDIVIDKYNIDINSFNLDKFAISFNLNNTKNELYDLITVNNYKVNINVILGGDPEPEVVVNGYTKSALNFENGIIDQVGTTVWNKEGTATVQNVNKIFGENSFETKVLGDSLYTNGNVITGGSTPFTIELYILLDEKSMVVDNSHHSLITTNYESIYNWNLLINRTNNFGLWINRINGNDSAFRSLQKVNFKEITKLTFTYDGACARVFVNDKLGSVIGLSSGFLKDINNKTTLFRSFIDNNSQLIGLIDNINIHDGIATKVRDPDPYEEFLVVDLAFDGENNSTKIVDNGSGKNNWTVSGNAKLSTTQPFDGFSSLYLDGNGDYIETSFSDLFVFDKSETTISFNVMFSLLPTINGTQSIFIASWDSNNNRRSFFYLLEKTSSGLNIVFSTSPNGLAVTKQIIFNVNFEINKNYKLDLNISSTNVSLFVNGTLINTVENILSNQFIDNVDRVRIGSHLNNSSYLNGYIKNFKIYKGVAVIPENPTGKIQLEFDNNVIDKYNNSTWANNGVTFDQVNSVKGYSAYFDTNTDYIETTSSSLNFADKNFKIDFDFKPNSFYAGGELLSGNTTSDSTNTSRFFIHCNDAGLGLGIYANNETITAGNIKIYNGIWYNSEFFRVGNNIFTKRNDSLIECRNVNFNLNLNNASFRLGKPNTSFGSTNNGINGYLDNFKTYKEDLTSELDKYYVGTSSSYIMNNLLKLSSSASSGVWVKENDNLSIKNFKLDVIYSKESGDNSIIFRTTSWNNTNDTFAYIINVSPTTIGFAKGSNATSGAFSWLKTTSFTSSFNKDYKLTIIANETYIEVYVDDVLYLTHNDSTYNISGYIGLRSYGTCVTYYKSMIIYDLSGNELYHKDWKSKIDNVVDKPAVHLPLETNATNVGFSALTINSVGSTTYNTVDGKKCIKFESGKYLSINSNNIFNLGTSSDFYIEFDFYPTIFTSTSGIGLFGNFVNSNSGVTSGSTYVEIRGSSDTTYHKKVMVYYRKDSSNVYNTYASSNEVFLNQFNNLIIKRKNNMLYIILNDIEVVYAGVTIPLDFSTSNTVLGQLLGNNNSNLNGYMSNFKMFVGTSEIPETYNDKKVLDLDFKPTGKSYLFKDNNNKCVIHPVDITQRDYQNSQYCCTFNGTNQYIQLGKNDALNFGLDDFVIEMKLKFITERKYLTVISGGSAAGAVENNSIMIVSDKDVSTTLFTNSVHVKASGSVIFTTATDTFMPNVINTIRLSRSNGIFSLYINDILIDTNNTQLTTLFNLNMTNNTLIGKVGHNTTENFRGTIYSIKVLRNTTDLTLLEDTNVTTNIEYTLQNDTESQVISTTTKSNNIKLVKDETLLKLTVDDQSVELANTDITNTITLTNTENYNNLTIYDTNVIEADYLDKDTFMDIQFPELDIIVHDNHNLISVSTENFGYDTYQGFLEGHTNRLFKIIHLPSNSVLFEGYDDYNIKYMDINYITEYQILDTVTSEMYPLMQNMEKGYIAGSFNNQLCKIDNVDLYIKVRRSDNYRMIGIYKLINSQYRIDNLDINSEYDIELFDNNKIIESLLLTRRKPITI